MPRIAALVCLLASLTALGASAASQPTRKTPTSDNDLILQEVDTLVALMTDGAAELYPKKPAIRYAPLSDKDAIDAVVLFGIAGWDAGNGETQFLAVFTSTSPTDWPTEWPLHRYHLAALLEVGEDYGSRLDGSTFDVKKSGVITVKGHAWSKNDARCCPSTPTSARFKYSDFIW